MNNSYDIMIIEDGIEVPLAAEMPGNAMGLPLAATMGFTMLALLFVVFIYFLRCYIYRSRIKELSDCSRRARRYDYKLSWNIFKLKDMEEELKTYLASSIQVE